MKRMINLLLSIIILLTFLRSLEANNKDTGILLKIWDRDNAKLYTNDDERVCLYDVFDTIYIHSLQSGKLLWSKEDIGQISPHRKLWCHSIGDYPLIFVTDKNRVSWFNLQGEEQRNKAGNSYIHNIGSTIITGDSIENGNNYIYNATTGELIETISKKALNNGYIFDFENGTIYYALYSRITAQNNGNILWKNIIRNWSNDDETQYYKEEYQYVYIPSNNYLFIRSVYFKGCCIYEDFTIKVINKKTGETAKDIKGLSYYAMFFPQNNNLYYATGYNNDTSTERWRKVYDEQGHTNTLHKMNIDTFEDDWTLNSEEYNYIITKREQVVDGKLYILLYDDCKYDEPLVHNKIQCIDVDSGEILATYKFENNVKEFGFTEKHLIVETVDGVTCYAFDEEDAPEPKPPINKNIILKFSIGEKSYNLDGETTTTDVAPVILNDRTLLPARYVCEPLGGQVFWDGEERKVTCKLVAPDNTETEEYKENIVELWIGKSTAKVNGASVQIDPDNPDVVPTIINDRTMVPMRFLAESLGCEVEWVAETKEIILTYTP